MNLDKTKETRCYTWTDSAHILSFHSFVKILFSLHPVAVNVCVNCSFVHIEHVKFDVRSFNRFDERNFSQVTKKKHVTLSM